MAPGDIDDGSFRALKLRREAGFGDAGDNAVTAPITGHAEPFKFSVRLDVELPSGGVDLRVFISPADHLGTPGGGRINQHQDVAGGSDRSHKALGRVEQ
jgi:hypothetical protein